MPAILAAILKVLGVVSTILGIANTLDAKPLAEEGHPLEIQTAVLATGQYVVDPVLGIPRVISNQAALLAALGSVQTTLLAAIGTPQQAGVAVTLPAPPAGYGGGSFSPSDVALIWAYISPATSQTVLEQLDSAGKFAVNVSAVARFKTQYAPFLSLIGPYYGYSSNAPTYVPHLSVYNAVPGDTVLSWAIREYPALPWALDATTGVVWATDTISASPDFTWNIDLTDTELLFLAGLGSTATAATAPVWPGLAGVTLGAPVALSPTCVVAGPMHGVIIDITSAAPRQVYQVFGGMQGYRFVGGLQFVDDNGEAERIQSIGMQHEVIVCKSMAKAASCSIRTDSAVTGTATPFVIT